MVLFELKHSTTSEIDDFSLQDANRDNSDNNNHSLIDENQLYQNKAIVPALASYGERLGAYVIDTIVLLIPTLLIFLLILVISGKGDEFSNDISNTEQSEVTLLIHQWFLKTVSFGVDWLYESLLISGYWQATLGKRVSGIVVTDNLGKRISFGIAVARAVLKSLSRLIYYVGYFVIFFSPKRQTLHDLLSKTIVIKQDI